MSETSEKKQLTTDNRVIEYILIRKDVKNINLRIKSSGEVLVSSNKTVSLSRVENFIKSKSDFIFKHLDKFEDMKKNAPAKKEYISGESFLFLGKSLRLKVLECEKENVYTDGIYLFLEIKNKDDFKRKEKLINSFFNEKCKEYFEEIVNETYPIFKKYDIISPNIKMRSMTSRWGSCIPSKNQITLNKKLIEVPRNSIEYVVLHEFSHFIHPNHSKKFYDFVTMLMPDWKERKRILETYAFRVE